MRAARGLAAFVAGLLLMAGACAEHAGEAGGGGTASPGVSAIEAAPAVAAAAPVARWVSGYYVGYQRNLYQPAEIDWSGLSHIVMGRLKANPDGSLVTDFDVDAVAGPELARDISRRAHGAGRRAILMLGGEGQGQAIARASAPSRRAAFVRNLVGALKTFGYDGLDLDWEDHVDLDLFLALIRDLKAAAPSAMLTVPGHAINPNIETTIDPRWIRVAQLVDQYNVMTYYPSTAYAGAGWVSWHNAPLKGAKKSSPVSIEGSLERYAAAGAPRAKLGLGLAFYAICYAGGITAPNQPTGFGVSIKGGDNDYPLAEVFGIGGAYSPSARRWDGDAENSYLTLEQPERHGCRYVSIEDEESIAAKGRFVRDRGFGGAIVWTINQGYVRTRPDRADFLMRALGKAFLQ